MTIPHTLTPKRARQIGDLTALENRQLVGVDDQEKGCHSLVEQPLPRNEEFSAACLQDVVDPRAGTAPFVIFRVVDEGQVVAFDPPPAQMLECRRQASGVLTVTEEPIGPGTHDLRQ